MLNPWRPNGRLLVEPSKAACNDRAAVLKSDIHHVSFADCLLLALAARLEGTVLTSYRKELNQPRPLAVCPIHFIR